jgi:two-component system nitrogen regulation response regulator GlnG
LFLHREDYVTQDDFSIDFIGPVEDNPALFLPDAFMTMRTSVFSLLLLSADPDLQAQFKQDLKGAAITVAKDFVSVPRAAVKRMFDWVIVETKRGQLQDLAEVYNAVDPRRTVIVAGSRSVLRQAPPILKALSNGSGRHSQKATAPESSVEGYLDSRLGDFVKDMKNGSARDLHPMLIRAVERPLITFVLKETNGNQIQAAHLLGMNRNTLRKKITELRIPLARGKARKA